MSQEAKRDQVLYETIVALNDYQETGLHITGDEAIAWLDTWGTDHETVAPTCRK